MLDLNEGRVDRKKVEDGVWWAIEITPERTFTGRALPGEPGDKPALLIRPQDVRYLRAREAAERPHLAAVRENRVDDATARSIAAEAVAKALWRGAANITVGKKPFEWTEDQAVALLAKVESWNLLDFILWASGVRSAVAAHEEESASGN